jgi:hypothetical protein
VLCKMLVATHGLLALLRRIGLNDCRRHTCRYVAMFGPSHMRVRADKALECRVLCQSMRMHPAAYALISDLVRTFYCPSRTMTATCRLDILSLFILTASRAIP